MLTFIWVSKALTRPLYHFWKLRSTKAVQPSSEWNQKKSHFWCSLVGCSPGHGRIERRRFHQHKEHMGSLANCCMSARAVHWCSAEHPPSQGFGTKDKTYWGCRTPQRWPGNRHTHNYHNALEFANIWWHLSVSCWDELWLIPGCLLLWGLWWWSSPSSRSSGGAAVVPPSKQFANTAQKSFLVSSSIGVNVKIPICLRKISKTLQLPPSLQDRLCLVTKPPDQWRASVCSSLDSPFRLRETHHWHHTSFEWILCSAQGWRYFAGSDSTLLHRCLCAFQSSAWHSREQYSVFLQRVQRSFPVRGKTQINVIANKGVAKNKTCKVNARFRLGLANCKFYRCVHYCQKSIILWPYWVLFHALLKFNLFSILPLLCLISW